MAELFTIRARGYSTEHGEREVGISCIAAPVVDLTGETVAALSVSGTADRMPEPLEGSPLAVPVVATARDVSLSLGAPR
jgi:IclR family acetate operon transcriptional repressor